MSIVDDLFAAAPGPVSAPADTGPTLDMTIPRSVLRNLMTRALAVIPARDAMPVLKHARLHATADRLSVTSTDTELTLISTTGQVAVKQPGTAVLPVRKVADILRSAGPQDVHLVVDSTGAHIGVGFTTWTLRIPSGADFPPDPPVAGDAMRTTIDADRFTDALAAVRYAAGTDAGRPALAAIDIRAGTVTACDGTRFAQAALPGFPLSITLPVAAVDRINRLVTWHSEIEVADLDRHISVRVDTEHDSDLFVVTKLAYPYPDLSATLLRPALTNRHQVVIDARELNRALGRVKHTADRDTFGVALLLSPNGTCTVACKDPHGNTSIDVARAQWTQPARVLTVHLQHLQDLVDTVLELDHCVSDMSLWLGEDTRTRRSPLLMREETSDGSGSGVVGVIQQMYLNWSEELT